jgi:hypothetical protein
MSGIDSGIDWPTIQGAIVEWMRDSTGLTVAWTRQPRAPQDGKPFATLWKLGGLRIVGRDAVAKKYNAETELIDRTLIGNRDFTVQAQVYTNEVAPGDDAMAILARAQTALTLPEFIRALGDHGVAILTSQPIQDLSAIAGADWESRAVMDVMFRVGMKAAAQSVPPIANVRRKLTLRDGNDGLPIVIESDE